MSAAREIVAETLALTHTAMAAAAADLPPIPLGPEMITLEQLIAELLRARATLGLPPLKGELPVVDAPHHEDQAPRDRIPRDCRRS